MAKVSITWAGRRTQHSQAVRRTRGLLYQKLSREAGYGANVIVQRIRKVFVQERLGGLLHESRIGEEKFVDWLRKTARHGVFNKPAPM